MPSEMSTDGADPASSEVGSPREMKGVDDWSSRGSSATSPVLPATPDGGATGTPKTPGFIGRVQARVRPDEIYREEIVRSIFGEVGTPVEDFSCAVESRILLHGRMYVTDTFVCFYSNLFGFEKTIKIPFCHMRCITKEKTALFIPNAIAIITSKKEYIFRSFWDREDAFRTLKACHQESLTQSPPLGEGALSRVISSNSVRGHREEGQSRRLARRRSSNSIRPSDSGVDYQDPRFNQPRRRIPWPGRGVGERRRPLSSVTGGDDDGDNKHDASTTSSTGSIASPRESAEAPATEQRDSQRLGDGAMQQSTVTGQEMEERGAGHGVEHGVERVAESREEHVEPIAIEGEGENDVDTASIVADPTVEEGERESRSEEGYDSEVDELGVEGTPVHAISLGKSTGGVSQSSKLQEFKLALDALGEGRLVARGGRRDQTDSGNSGAARRITTELPCQLQKFFDMFFANDAEKGLPAFHVSQGDSEVKVTPWKVAGGSLGMTREIRFVHPFSAPIGPNRTRTVKLQRCRLYDEHGLIIETSTHLEDIMMSDHFHIEDRCIVQPTGDGSIRVDVEVEIKFLKSTMFRKTIETKSLNESREVWEAFFHMAKEAIQSMQPALPLLPPSGVNDSDDEARMRATRERLRERRKRHRNRVQPPHHTHHPARDHSTESLSSVNAAKAHTVRPRAKSASSRIPSGLLVEEKPDGPERKVQVAVRSGGSALQASVSSAWTPSFWFAAVPWVLLAIVFLLEGLQVLRFSRETAGFLEAAEAALAVIGSHEGEEGNVRETFLREELARGLLKIYSRNRFFWPLNTLL